MLEEITLPEKVNYIGNSAFAGCDRLRKIRFKGDRLKELHSNSFTECSRLKFELPLALKGIKLVYDELHRMFINGEEISIEYY